ncbi:MAG TPA: VOC family protein [Candidatus Binataceae bacterium]
MAIQEKTAPAEKKHIRHGIGSVRPYLYGHLDLLEFVRQAFGAVELERLKVGANGFHVEAKIGDSMIVMEAGEPPPAGGTRASIYVYVEDVDAAYARAIRAGATSIAEPADKPYQERGAGVKDSFGNTWWIATYTG